MGQTTMITITFFTSMTCLAGNMVVTGQSYPSSIAITEEEQVSDPGRSGTRHVWASRQMPEHADTRYLRGESSEEQAGISESKQNGGSDPQPCKHYFSDLRPRTLILCSSMINMIQAMRTIFSEC